LDTHFVTRGSCRDNFDACSTDLVSQPVHAENIVIKSLYFRHVLVSQILWISPCYEKQKKKYNTVRGELVTLIMQNLWCLQRFIKPLLTCVAFTINKMHTIVSKSMLLIFCRFRSIVWFLSHYCELCLKSLGLRCISVPLK
jgi:hypothetical protein